MATTPLVRARRFVIVGLAGLLVGIGLWLVALNAALVLGPLVSAANDWWVWACVAVLAFGLIALVYAHRSR